MQKVERTGNQIFRFAQVAQNYMAQHPERTKFWYALSRAVERISSIQTKIQNRVGSLNLQFCAVDEKEIVILRNNMDGQYDFKRAQQIERDAAVEKLLEEKVEIEPYLATELPKLGTELQVDQRALENAARNVLQLTTEKGLATDPRVIAMSNALDNRARISTELNETQLEVFSGIVISEADVEAYRRKQDELLETVDIKLTGKPASDNGFEQHIEVGSGAVSV